MHTWLLVAGLSAGLGVGDDCPVDPGACPIPQIGSRNVIRVLPVPRLQESGLDTTEDGLPPQAFSRLPLGPFFVEIWAQQAAGYCDEPGGENVCLPGNPSTCLGQPQLCDPFGLGIESVHVDLLFDGSAMLCTGLGLSGPYSSTGLCGFGTVDEFGGCTTADALGITPDWVRIGTVTMTALQAGASEIILAPADSVSAIFGCGAIPDTRVFFGTAPVFFFTPQSCTTPSDCDGNIDLCDGVETCFGNQCIPLPNSDVECSGSELCDPSDGACKECFVDAHCDDANGCTVDACIDETCVYDPVDCNDEDPCTVDSCSVASGSCVNEAIMCPDGLLCNSDDGVCTTPCALPCDLPMPPYILPIHVDLMLEPGQLSNVTQGQVLEVGIYAIPEFPLVDTLVAAIDVIIEWDPQDLRLSGVIDNSPYDWIDDVPYFPDDCQIDCLNSGLAIDGIPENDGDALFEVLGQFQSPVGQGPAVLPPEGLLVATLQFEVIGDSGVDSDIAIVDVRDMTCSQVLWGGIEFRCLFNDFPCDPTNAFSCGGSDFCVPTETIPGCNILGQVDSMSVQGPCENNCGDTDDNGIIDDICFWQSCTLGDCELIERRFADMGGPFGGCMIDGTADGNDRFHALNCFANVNPEAPPPATYPCEPAAPSALNVDAGGSFGSCTPDGVCDGNDAFAALNAFAAAGTCSCPLDGGSAPTFTGPNDVGSVHVTAVAGKSRIQPGDRVEVDVLLSSGFDDVRGYQLHLGVDGGAAGHLELVDIAIHSRDRAAPRSARHAMMPATSWSAFNLAVQQVVVGTDQPGVKLAANTYLATFTYRASADARGTFVIDILADQDDAAQRTFIFPSPSNGRVNIEKTAPAVIEVIAAERKSAE